MKATAEWARVDSRVPDDVPLLQPLDHYRRDEDQSDAEDALGD
jgi:hypothetical protein